jgi:gliding motility-associated-like protein
MKNLQLLLIGIIFIFSTSTVKAQCTDDNTWSGDPTVVTGCPGNANITLDAGEYIIMDIVQGNIYTISTCPSTCNTNLTLFDGAGVVLASNDDSPTGANGCSEIVWAATATGTINLSLDMFQNIGNPCVNSGCVGTTISISCSTPPANTEPCGATVLPVNAACVPQTFDNTNVGNSTMFIPGCASYVGNDIWFSFTIPATGGADIDLGALGMTDSGMAMYTSTTNDCNNLLEASCDDDGGTGSMSNIAASLPPGTQVWIRVWGFNGQVGTFDICITETTPVITASDCNDAIDVCTNAGFTIDPNGQGLINDVPANGSIGNPGTNPSSANMGCLLAGETNSTWMVVTIETTGNLEFVFGGGGAQAGFYDWAVWPYNNNCGAIAGGTIAPVTCNWNASNAGGTGAVTVIPGGGNAGNYEPALAVTCGDQYLICFSNFSSATSTVPMDFGGSATVSCSGAIDVNSFDITICEGGTGDITANGADTYVWSPPIGLSGTTGTTVTANPTVTTVYTVTGTTGCLTNDTTITVIVEPAPIVIPNYIHPVTGATVNDTFLTTCENSVITLNASGSVSGYVWSPATGLSCTNCDNPVATLGTTDITYTVTGFSANNCPFTSIFNFIIADPEVTFTVTDETCEGLNDGSATANVTGGTPLFTYSWNTGPIQTTQTITNLADGNYQVTVTDANGCTAIGDTTILPGILVTAGITPEVNQCLTGNSFGFTNTGTTGVTYAWDFGDAAPGTSTNEDPTYTYPAAGTFTVTQTVSSGVCNDVATINVTVNPMPVPTAIQDSVDCFGGNTGTASVNLPVPSGTAPYTYLWNNPAPAQTTQTATALTAGAYTVTVTDANLCPGTVNITVLEPTVLAPTAVQVNPSCNGFTDGTATATGVDGTAGYTYSWNTAPIQNTQIATGLGAGTYTCTVTDFHGCTETVDVTLIDPPGMTLTPSMIPANCGLADGDATVNVAGGVGPFTYLWNDGAAQTTQTATNIGAATYTVVVTDQGTASCTVDTTITVTTTAGIIANATLIQDALCTDSLNGMAYATPVGGTPLYTYAWSDGAGLVSTDSILTAGAGNYTLVITDGVGCTGDTTITIAEPAQIVATISNPTDPSCFGFANGNATAAGAGGTVAGAYIYSWNDGASQSVANATGLAAGTYIVTVTDDNLCSDTASITLIDGPLMVSSVIDDSVNCFGANDGSANLTVSGGTGFTFNWPVSGDNIEDPTGLSAGQHYVIINSAEGCTLNDTIIIYEPTQLVTVLDSSFDASCNGFSDGSAFTTTTGGTGTYSYSWTTAPAQTTDDANFLAFGVYNLTVTDANNCQTTTIANINQPAPLNANTGSFDAYCGLAQGTVWVSPTNGTPGFTYAWDSSGIALGTNTNDTLNGLYPGSYNIVVDDANGCKYNTIVVVNPAPGGNANISASTDVSCFGGNDGIATVSTAGAFPGFTYLWDDPIAQTNNPATGLIQGTYNVTVTDTFGCIMNANVLINEPTVLNLNLFPNPQTCPDLCNAIIASTLTGGTAPYTYLWNDPSSQITPSVGGLCGGTYTVIATDSLGCLITDSATVTIPPAMTLANVTVSSNCNQANGAATASVTSNGVAPFTFSWSDGTSIISNTDSLVNVIAGTYYATAIDFAGCSVTDTVNISDLSGPSIMLDSIYNVQCFGGNEGYAEVQVSAGITPYTYLWDDPIGQTTPSASNLLAGNYIVVATDSSGCTASLGVVITQPNNITLTAGGTDPSCFSFTDGSVWVNANGGTGGEYTYLWNDPLVTANDTVYNLASGTYTVTVADSNGCSDFIAVVLNNPLLFTVSVTGNNVTCTDVCNGDATTTLSNGVGVITYLWNDPSAQSTPNASGLCADTVSVIVTDGMGCIATDALIITQPDSLILTEATHSNVSCFGGNDGFSSVTFTGGTGPYTYSWNLTGTGIVSTNQAANNLVAGSYLVTINDFNTCSYNINVVITEPNLLTAIVVPIDADCAGANTGSATVAVVGGTTPYSYQWDDIALQQTALADNLLAGNYCVTVSDSFGLCSTTICNVVINEPAAIALGVTTTSSTCGTNNGTASVAFGGGTGAPTFAWATIPVQTTAVANNLFAGNYQVIVTDQNGCTDSITASITDLGGPTATIPAFTNASCTGISDGTAQSSVTGGAYPYTFLWAGTGGGGATPNDSLATGLAGQVGGQIYNLTVTDFNGCIATASVSISENPSVVTVINASNDVSCFGGNDGDASAISSGGTGIGTYTYSWDASAIGQTTPTATNLIAGTYNVTVTDANLCTATDQIIITQPDLLTINSFTIDSVNCSGNSDGIIDINVIGGTSGYTYVWNPATAGAGPTAAALFAGVYDVTVTDANLCTTTGNYTVFTPDPLAIGAITVQSTCGNANGSAQVTLVTGGTTSYSYSWNTPNVTQTTALASNLSAGNYVATVNDANGCTTSEAVIITDKPLPIIDSILVYNVSCFGLFDGSAKVFVTGNDPISYSWNDPANQSTDSIFGLASSLPLYTVTVTDSNNCTTTGVAQITQPNELTANINAPYIICYGQDFQVFANANGGTLPYADFAWTGEITQNGTSQGPIFDTLTVNGTYTLVVTDDNNCQSAPVTHFVNVRAKPTFLITEPTPICEGESAILFPINIAGGDPSQLYLVNWMEADSSIAPTTYSTLGTSDSLIVNPVDTTNYAVYINNVGCSTSDTLGVKVVVNKVSVNNFFLVDPVCHGEASEFSVSNNTGVTFSWDFNGDSIADQTTTDTNTLYIYPYHGMYDVSVTVTTAEGCESTAYYPFQAQVNQNPVADFATDPSPAIVTLLNPTVEFSDLSEANDTYLSRDWDFDDGSFSIDPNPIHIFTDTGFYNVTQTIVNLEGCIDSITKTIRVKPEFLFIIPNTITPDGDGLNEIFMPGTMIGVDEKDYNFYVFDRWGELLYEGHNLTDGWDGHYKGNLVKTGVYVWRIEVTDLEGVVHKYTGNVNVIR